MKRCVRAVAHATVLATATGGCGPASVHAAEPRATLAATLIVQADDPRLARARLERRYLGHPEGPARQGLDVALDEGRFELQAGRAAVALAQQAVDSPAAARAAAQAAERGGAAVLLTDLPADWTLAVADAVAVPVVNIGNADDRLREQDCRARLFHVVPSERMRADALAQTLVSRNWRKVLLLQGPGAEDRARGATVQAALRRFGLQVVETRAFKPSGDPRERDLANPLLLTAGGGYDVVWVVDADGEFARGLPYRIASPRPVVGDAGLVAVAWHTQFERFGAPQVSRRFARAAGRPMAGADWSAWMAGKALVAAATAAPAGPGAAWAKALAETPLDGAKGAALSFRAWDRQLRQTVLLTDGQGVVSQAPVDGLLHPTHTLDTLGADAPERRCKTSG
ncbi:type 1 periplasmic-binding domain-containing protein [Variovorax sp. PvP013]|uniref:branched-chain amino acid ABC transporter substrate-binding protein n=1 Tax=Variovorax sp. PvP013 TaxID=3156435 RepID=UPI003D1FA3E4